MAVGQDQSIGDGSAAVWISADGDTWRRIPHDEAVFGGDGQQQMEGVIVWAGRLVAFGSDSSGGDTDAAVWTSADGEGWQRVAHDESVFGGSGEQSMTGAVVWNDDLVIVGYTDRDGFDAAVWVASSG